MLLSGAGRPQMMEHLSAPQVSHLCALKSLKKSKVYVWQCWWSGKMAGSQLSTCAVLVSIFLVCLTRAGWFGCKFSGYRKIWRKNLWSKKMRRFHHLKLTIAKKHVGTNLLPPGRCLHLWLSLQGILCLANRDGALTGPSCEAVLVYAEADQKIQTQGFPA